MTALLASAALLLPVTPDVASVALAAMTTALLCAVVVSVAVARRRTPVAVVLTTPVDRRLRGRVLQQSRPGVSGRIRARAPGCGR